MSFRRPADLLNISIPVTTGWLLASCLEAKGKQELWTRQKPEVLRVLREQAIVQSAESSNRIEGVTVARDRLQPILLGKAKPRDRSEEELVGYRRALNWIFTRKKNVPIDAKTILHLHKLAQGGFSGDAGKWKTRDNEIIEILPNGERHLRFKPTSARKTAKAIDDLCRLYADLLAEERFPPLLAVATFVLDFLCIHPFRDGNGRVSRLLTTLLLQQQDYLVGRFISLERLVEETKEDYYRILNECSHGWHENKNDLLPWWNYFLSTVRRAHLEFERRLDVVSSSTSKADLVRLAVLEQVGPFTLAELKAQCPSVSEQLIKKTLATMKREGTLQLTGHGRSAQWRRT
ncbi:MAG TPA: Fic family protein [bacterium]|nr:Fic family protein [bacterium]